MHSIQFAANLSSLLTPIVSRPLPLTQGVWALLDPPAAMFPSPPTKGVRVAAVLTPLCGQSSQLPPATTSPPPWGLRAGRPCRIILQFYLPTLVWPLAAPPPHPLGEGSEPAGQLVPDQQHCVSFPLFRMPPDSGPARPLGLTWSTIVLAWTHRLQLRQQVPQLRLPRIFWPYMIAASRAV